MAESLGFNYELTDFSGEVPVFPLPNVVFLPKTLLPLHIFEPRYQAMLKDVLAGDHLMVVALLKDGWESFSENPPIHQVGTIGYIEEYEPLEDGKSNIVLNGLAKVRITELPQTQLYRQGKIQIIQDKSGPGNATKERLKLLNYFEQVARLVGKSFPSDLFEKKEIPLETLTNLMATWLPIPASEKQKLLEIDNIMLRSKIVRGYLRREKKELSEIDFDSIVIPDDPQLN